MNKQMNKAAQLAQRLEQVGVADGMKMIMASNESALCFDVIDEAMCIMHSDGSVNFIDRMGEGKMSVEAISSENILKVLKHYRPFKDVFKKQVQ